MVRGHNNGQDNQNQTRRWRVLWGIIGSISIIVLLVGFIGCGKLSDDINRPSSPAGTSGGNPVPIGPKTSAGTHSLTAFVDPMSVPADMTNYAVITATLSDTSGRPVQGYKLTYYAPSSRNIGWFWDPVGGEYFNTTERITDQNGQALVRIYGSESGTEVINISVDLDQNGTKDLTTAVTMRFTSGEKTPSSAGNYSLKLWASPTTVPADSATYSTVVATVTDRSGGSVEGFTVTFTAELGRFRNGGELSKTVTGITNERGSASLLYYGMEAGSDVITAKANINDLTGPQGHFLEDSMIIHVTKRPGVPGTKVPGVRLTVDKTGVSVSAGTCGKEAAVTEAFKLTARVWDELGNLVGSGHRVELTGGGVNPNLRRDGLTDSNGKVEFEYSYTYQRTGDYPFEVIAHVFINGKEYTDTVTYFLTVTCNKESTP